MTVQVLKLSSGETIMADVLEMDDEIVTVANAIEVKTEQTNEWRMNMIAYQWLPMPSEVNYAYIKQQHVIAMTTANGDMQEYYVSVIEKLLYPEKSEEKQLKEKQEFYEKIKKMSEEIRKSNLANNETTVVH